MLSIRTEEVCLTLLQKHIPQPPKCKSQRLFFRLRFPASHFTPTSCVFEYSVARWEGGVSQLPPVGDAFSVLELSLGDGIKIPGEPGLSKVFEL